MRMTQEAPEAAEAVGTAAIVRGAAADATVGTQSREVATLAPHLLPAGSCKLARTEQCVNPWLHVWTGQHSSSRLAGRRQLAGSSQAAPRVQPACWAPLPSTAAVKLLQRLCNATLAGLRDACHPQLRLHDRVQVGLQGLRLRREGQEVLETKLIQLPRQRLQTQPG